eukprot:1192939-Prorocentrum_minimum.AAC.1
MTDRNGDALTTSPLVVLAASAWVRKTGGMCGGSKCATTLRKSGETTELPDRWIAVAKLPDRWIAVAKLPEPPAQPLEAAGAAA